jgi:hypothetical protein
MANILDGIEGTGVSPTSWQSVDDVDALRQGSRWFGR